MKLYNSLTNNVEQLKTISDEQFTIYTCGPTVYDDVHIGNLSSFIYADTLARTLKTKYKIKHVINITDVDDKTISRSHQLYPKLDPKVALSKLSTNYETKFKIDITRLNIYPSNYTFVRATESIELMQQLITQLLETDFAYLADDGIYFSINKYIGSGKQYGKLVHLHLTEKDSSRSRINNDEYDKQTIHDFALWKFVKDNEPSWDFKVNGENYPGRPGWHIECSAMSTNLLGQPFDIHTGGVDLKFPHHENEITQSTTEKDSNYLAKTFFHSEHLLIDDQKMSKSLNNFYTLDDILKKIDDPIAFRVLILQSNYKNRADFSFENLISAYRRLLTYQNFSSLRFQFDHTNKSNVFDFKIIQEIVRESMFDDLNSTKALAELSVFINKVGNSKINHNQSKDFQDLIKFIDDILGFNLGDTKDITVEQKDKLAERFSQKENSNWQKSDLIRDELKSNGIGINDVENDQIWFRL